MKKYLFLFILGSLLTSCASILNKNAMNVYLYTQKPTHIIYQSDTTYTDGYEEINTAKLSVPRSKDSLQFELLTDSISKKISIPSKISLLYYANIAYPLLWPGLLIDLSNSNRYTYKDILVFDDSLSLSMALNSNNGTTNKQKTDIIKKHNYIRNTYKKKRVDKFHTEKGDFYLYFALPFVYPSHTIIKPNNRPSYMEKGSALGFAGGFDYYYKKNRFINISASYSLGGDLVFGCVDFGYDDREVFSLYNITISHNHRYKRFSFGYGLSHSYVDWWKEKYFEPLFAQDQHTDSYNSVPSYSFVENKYSNLGFVFNGYYYFSNGFSAGIVYKPTLIRLNSIMDKKLCYEHQISLDIAFKVRLSKRK